MASASRRRVVILLHERDAKAERRPYQVWGLADAWRRGGTEVVVQRGVGRFVDADAVVNHVDLTVVPAPYREHMARYPVAVNGRAVDISKRRVSAQLLARGDAWTGPVIVKTDANCGGKRERELQLAPLGRFLADLRFRLSRRPWRVRRVLPTDEYPVFESVAEVPRDVWDNPALVVERFLPETADGLYAARSLTLLGDRAIGRQVWAKEPVVKAARRVKFGEVTPHAEAFAAAARLGIEHGKIDYVVHEGRAVVLDANRTPTFGPRSPPELRREIAERLAPGLEVLLAPR